MMHKALVVIAIVIVLLALIYWLGDAHPFTHIDRLLDSWLEQRKVSGE